MWNGRGIGRGMLRVHCTVRCSAHTVRCGKGGRGRLWLLLDMVLPAMPRRRAQTCACAGVPHGACWLPPHGLGCLLPQELLATARTACYRTDCMLPHGLHATAWAACYPTGCLPPPPPSPPPSHGLRATAAWAACHPPGMGCLLSPPPHGVHATLPPLPLRHLRHLPRPQPERAPVRWPARHAYVCARRLQTAGIGAANDLL